MNRTDDINYAIEMLKQINTPADVIDSIAVDIVLSYNQSNRHYHRFSHIKSMYQAFHEIINYTMLTSGYVPDKERVRCCVAAILFHDIVYDTQQKSDYTLEELSAEEAKKRAYERIARELDRYNLR
jgi:predicted metal-dependent HD superfamily phosphohydrolase